MQKFNVGDKIEQYGNRGVVACWSDEKGKGVINWEEGTTNIYENCDVCGMSNHFHGGYTNQYTKLISSAKKTMVKLTSAQEKHLDEESKILIKIGVLDANLRVADSIKAVEMLIELNRKGLALAAKEEVKAEAAKKPEGSENL